MASDTLGHPMAFQAGPSLTGERLRALVDAQRRLAAERQLRTVHRRTVELACALVGAEYSALGVLADDGSGREELAAASPTRRGSGLPKQANAASGVLDIPVTVRDELYGRLHVSRDRFTAEDEQLLCAFAVTAGSVIESAILSAEAAIRERWLEASTDVTLKLLAGPDTGHLRLVASTLERLAGADIVTVAQPDDELQTLRVGVAVGRDAAHLEGTSYPLPDTVSWDVLQSGDSVLLDDARSASARSLFLASVLPIGPVMVLALAGSRGPRGTLVVGRRQGSARFTRSDLDMATTFANQAALALELAEGRRGRQQVALLEERAHIARDLHDHVIQQLFAAGMLLQRSVAGLEDERHLDTLRRGIALVDQAIHQIRSSIYHLQPMSSADDLRTAVGELSTEMATALGFEPRVIIDGPLERLSDEELVADVLGVLREALTNVAQHASASQVDVFVHVTSSGLAMTISDDGVGPGESPSGRGLARITTRATQRGGSCAINDPAPSKGTVIRWRVPLN